MQKHFVFIIFLGGAMADIQLVWSNGCNMLAAIRILQGESSLLT